MNHPGIEDQASAYKALAAIHERLTVRHALLGHDRIAAAHAQLVVTNRAEARDLHATAFTKYTGEDLYAAVTA